MNDAPLSQRSQAPDPREQTSERDALIGQLAGALRFILAFYEPGQRYLDTNAWKLAEAGGRRALAKAEEHIKSVPSIVPTPARGASPQESLPESNNQSETRILIDRFSSLDDLTKRDRGDNLAVLRALDRVGKFSCFEMEGALAYTVTDLFRDGLIKRLDSAYPWVCVEITAAGRALLSPPLSAEER